MVKKRRIWTEFLSPEVLGAPDTVALLRRFQLQPLVAMPPDRQGPKMAEALGILHDSGVSVGLWPLLPDREGYWLSADNAQEAVSRVRELLAFASESGASVATVALDLEPGLALKKQMYQASGWQSLRYLRDRLRETGTGSQQSSYQDAVAHYSQLANELRRAGIESLAIAVPPLLIDLAANSERWQRFFATPLTAPGWDTPSPMVYRSMIQQSLPGRSRLWGRALFAESCRRWALQPGPLCMSLGVVGPGKLEDERAYESPAELRWDVACAAGHGIDDLALFSLESVLARPNPEEWLRAFTESPLPIFQPWDQRLAQQALRVLLQSAASLTRRLG